ncbi:ATP-dependent DNA helicase SRS2-like protein [Camellia lanceoleosa]|nr:ATP-dependent DNA helicase SRS2-like protein [Camellia lanceoleosa]
MQISVKECCNEVAQCAFVVDNILEITSEGSSAKCSYGNIDVLYRRQCQEKCFKQLSETGKYHSTFMVVRAIIAMLRTTLPSCDDGSFCRVFKALQPFDKEEKKKGWNGTQEEVFYCNYKNDLHCSGFLDTGNFALHSLDRWLSISHRAFDTDEFENEKNMLGGSLGRSSTRLMLGEKNMPGEKNDQAQD